MNTTAIQILLQVRAAGLSLAAERHGIKIMGPRSAITDDLRDILRIHKAEIIEALTIESGRFIQPPAIMGEQAVERIHTWLRVLDTPPGTMLGAVEAASGRH